MAQRKWMLPSIDTEIHRRIRPAGLGSFLYFLCFWGGGPTLRMVASTLGRGGGLGREPGVMMLKRDTSLSSRAFPEHLYVL